MSYQRVIPRDLFNESNLLKCYGVLYLKLECLGKELLLINEDSFDIVQNVDGELSIYNIYLQKDDLIIRFWRPLNSREQYPLYGLIEGDEEEKRIEVFRNHGFLTDEFKQII